jgi:hypothetical protein
MGIGQLSTTFRSDRRISTLTGVHWRGIEQVRRSVDDRRDVQCHSARVLHHDFRLERNSVPPRSARPVANGRGPKRSESRPEAGRRTITPAS